MKKRRLFFTVLAVVLAFSMFSMLVGCDKKDAGSTSDAPKDKVTIGIINPYTGPLAGFGEGEDWIDKLILDYINTELGGVEFSKYGKKLPLEIKVYDSESDTTKATELAQKLIQEDKIDLMVVRHTPETVNPVAAVCERFEIPCISVDAPVEAWQSLGEHKWNYHAFWNLEEMYGTYKALWTDAGFAPNSGAKIGLLFANDADGTSWAEAFNPRIQADGYTLVDPGQYPSGTQDFSSIIQQFMTEGVQIVVGTNINPDFANFWRQCKQLGYQPDFVTMGKAYLLESDAMAIGPDLMDGLCGEVWWSPTHPWKSALTGETPATLTEKYKTDTGRNITQPMGIKYASLELAYDVLVRAGSLDKNDILAAIGPTNLDTMFGNISYTADHYGLTPLVGGQWVKNDQGGLDLIVVNNSLHPNIPTTGTLKPLK